MSAKEKNKRVYDYKQKEVQKIANNLLDAVIYSLSTKLPDVFWNCRWEEDQDDIGIDMQCELINKNTNTPFYIFKIQNKGSENLHILKNTDNKGLISYQIPLAKARYYLYQINVALMLVVCDVKLKKVFWHAIQLDNTLEERIELAASEKKKSIQVYIDPKNEITANNIELFLQQVKQSFDLQVLRFNQYLQHPLFSKNYEPQIDKSKHLLDQLYESITIYFDEFSYIPPHELLALYPFKQKNGGLSYYKGFEAYISEDLKNIFLEIKDSESITDPSIMLLEDVSKKANTIKRVLFTNGIEYVTSLHSSDYIKISYTEQGNESCDCCRCQFNKMNFKAALIASSSLNENDNIDTIFKKGYIQYKLGNYITSYSHFKEGIKKAKKDNKWVLYGIGLFNIKKLKTFIEFNSFEHKDYENKLQEIKSIQFESEFLKIEQLQVFGVNFLRTLKNEMFYAESFIRVTNIFKAIEKHYYSQIDGGTSNNSYANNLLSELYQITSFLNYNFIIYDNFSDFDQLIDLACNGYICSYSMHDTQKSKLQHFNGNVLHQLLLYSKPDNLITYYKRYKSKPFSFPLKENNSILYQFGIQFLNGINAKTDSSFLEEGNFKLSQINQNVFSNICVLLALSEVSNQEIESFIDTFLQLQEYQDIVHSNNIKYFKFLIFNKSSTLSYDAFERLLHLSLTHPVFHAGDYIDVLTDAIKNHHSCLKVPDSDIPKLILTYKDICVHCNQKHSKSDIIYYWFICSSQGQKAIEDFILESLYSQFDPDLFYSASIFELVGHSIFIDSFIEFAKPKSDRKTIREVFNWGTSPFSRPIDMLLNLLYNFNYDLNDKRFDVFRNYSLYYSWLFNLNGFDYTKFEPIWILNHPTLIFLDKFKPIPEIKDAVKKYLQSNNSPVLLKIHLEHFS